MENSKIKKVVPIILIMGLTFITSLTLNLNPFSDVLPGHDSSMFLYFGYAMDSGKTIYTEIFDHKGPLIFLINYFGTKLSTPYFHGTYVFEVASLFIYFLYSYKTLNLWVSSIPSFLSLLPQAVVLTHFLEGGNLTEEYALPFIGVSLFIFAKYFINPEKLRYFEIVILGASAALVFSLRANMVVLWLVFCFFIALEKLLAKEFVTLLKFVLYFVLGLLAVFLPIGLYLYFNGALEAGIFQSLIFNVMYLDQTTNKADAIRRLVLMLRDHYIILVFAMYIVYATHKWRSYDKSERLFTLSVLLFSIGSFLANTLSGRAYPHYLMALTPTMTIPMAIMLQHIPKTFNKISLSIVGVLFVYLIYYPLITNTYDKIYVTNVSNINDMDEISHLEKNVINNRNKNEQINEVVEVIQENTMVTDEIYVHRNAGNLYLLSERLSSIKYFNLPSVNFDESPEVAEDFMNDIRSADTELIIYNQYFIDKNKTEVEQEFYEYINENYDLIYKGNNYYIHQLR